MYISVFFLIWFRSQAFGRVLTTCVFATTSVDGYDRFLRIQHFSLQIKEIIEKQGMSDRDKIPDLTMIKLSTEHDMLPHWTFKHCFLILKQKFTKRVNSRSLQPKNIARTSRPELILQQSRGGKSMTLSVEVSSILIGWTRLSSLRGQ